MSLPKVQCHYQKYNVTTKSTMSLPKLQCRYHVTAKTTMSLPKVQCHFQKYNVTTKTTMSLPKLQCHFQKYNVTTQTTMSIPKLQCHYPNYNVNTKTTMSILKLSNNIPDSLFKAPTFKTWKPLQYMEWKKDFLTKWLCMSFVSVKELSELLTLSAGMSCLSLNLYRFCLMFVSHEPISSSTSRASCTQFSWSCVNIT